jgi:hypothetical protein
VGGLVLVLPKRVTAAGAHAARLPRILADLTASAELAADAVVAGTAGQAGSVVRSGLEYRRWRGGDARRALGRKLLMLIPQDTQDTFVTKDSELPVRTQGTNSINNAVCSRKA